MNIIGDLEISTLLIILYILFRGYARNRIQNDTGRGGAGAIIILGAVIFFALSQIIRLICIFAGLALILIPTKEEKEL